MMMDDECVILYISTLHNLYACSIIKENSGRRGDDELRKQCNKTSMEAITNHLVS